MRHFLMILAAVGLAAPFAAQAQMNYSPPSAGQVVTCSSNDNRMERCRVPGWTNARLVQQTSQAACVWGRTWGFDRGGLWVDKGCRGEFTAAYGGQPGGPGAYPPVGNQVVNCGSVNYKQARCAVPNNWRGARLLRQTSQAACTYGRTWGFNYGSIWVGDGCSGEFAADDGGGGWRPGNNWDQNIQLSCGSPQYRYALCRVDVGAHGSVVLQQQISNERCVLGRNWGWNRAGVWVDKGCSGRFTVMRRW